MRLFAMVIGPSTYAFSAVVAIFIVALAVGSVAGTIAAARTKRPIELLAMTLIVGAVCALWASLYAGTALPVRLVDDLPALSPSFLRALVTQSLIIASVVMPCVIALGVSYPLALGLAAGSHAGRWVALTA